VVDDDPLSSALQSHLAALLGYDARVEVDPIAAVNDALNGRYDAMLLDLGMPGLDGFDVLARLRDGEADRERQALPVIAVTGYASEVDRLRCLKAGFNDHLAKPILATALGVALARATGRPPDDCPSVDGSLDNTVDPPLMTDAQRLRATVRRLAQGPNDEPAFAPTVTEAFAMRAQQLVERLRQSVGARDATQCGNAARALRAGGEFLGATRLGEMCEALEVEATAGRWNAAERTLDALDFEHQAMLTLLFESPG